MVRFHTVRVTSTDSTTTGLQGRVAWNKGKKMSLETRQKMSLAKQGRSIPRSVRRQMSKSHQGLTHTPVCLPRHLRVICAPRICAIWACSEKCFLILACVTLSAVSSHHIAPQHHRRGRSRPSHFASMLSEFMM